MRKKFISILLSLLLMLPVLTVSSNAQILGHSDADNNGICGAQGDNLTWHIDDEGCLHISGNGDMMDYNWEISAPWYAPFVKRIEYTGNITSIGSSAFKDCYCLSEVIIPDSVTSIGEKAFCGCTGLKSIKIGDGVTTIGDFAFSSCSRLVNVEAYGTYPILEPEEMTVSIGKNVKHIGNYAFLDNYAIRSVKIPASVKEIGEGAFMICGNIEKFEVAPENSVYSSSGNCLIEKSTKTMLFGGKDCVIPNDGSVTKIADFALYSYMGKEIDIPDTVTTIGSCAFLETKGPSSVSIPESVTEIADNAFLDQFFLKEYYIYNTELDLSASCIGLGSFDLQCGSEDFYNYQKEALKKSLEECEFTYNNNNVLCFGNDASEFWADFYSNIAFTDDSRAVVPGVVIHGYEGSTAQTYAEKYGFEFIPITDVCTHSVTVIRNYVQADCENDGYSGDEYCADCGELISKGSVIAATGHSDSDFNDKCDNCGNKIEIEGGYLGRLFRFILKVLYVVATVLHNMFPKKF